MENTPSKYSKVGRDAIKRMYAEGKIRGDISGIDNLDFDSLEFKSGDKWYNISEGGAIRDRYLPPEKGGN